MSANDKVLRSVHIPRSLFREVEAGGFRLANADWLLMLRERLQRGHALPVLVQEWRPGERAAL